MQSITRISAFTTLAVLVGAAIGGTTANACGRGYYRSYSYAPTYSYGYGYGYGNFPKTNLVNPGLAPAIQPGVTPAPAIAPALGVTPAPAIAPALGVNPAPAIAPGPAAAAINPAPINPGLTNLNPAPINPGPAAPIGPVGGGPVGGGPVGGGPVGGGLNPNNTSLEAPAPVAANDPPVNPNQTQARLRAQ